MPKISVPSVVIRLSPAVITALESKGKMHETHDQILRRELGMAEDRNYWRPLARRRLEAEEAAEELAEATAVLAAEAEELAVMAEATAVLAAEEVVSNAEAQAVCQQLNAEAEGGEKVVEEVA